MKHHKLHLMPLCLGILALATAESVGAAENMPAENEGVGSTTIIVAADLFREASDGGDPLDLAGGSVEYLRSTAAGAGFRIGLTALSGTREPGTPDNLGISVKTEATDIRLHALYTPASATWLGFGVEYIHEQRDVTIYRRYKHLVDRGTPGRPNLQWDGSYDTKVSDPYSDSGNSLFLKSTLSGPSWHLLSGSRRSLTLTPSLDVEAGYMFGNDDADGSFVYIGAAKVRIAYAFGYSTLFMEGGYRGLGAFESGSETISGEFVRVGFGYRW